MSTALERDIRNALADFGRPVPADATLTAGVRELIAAVSESESESDRDAAIRRECVTASECGRLQKHLADAQASLTNALATGRLAADRYRALRRSDRLVAFAVGIAFAVVAQVLWTVL